MLNLCVAQENDFGESTKSAGKTVLLLWNLLLRANAELEVTDKVSVALNEAVDKAKAGGSVRFQCSLPLGSDCWNATRQRPPSCMRCR